jgi:hypothetical protein
VTYKAYIDNIKAKTGKSPNDFMALARQKGFVKDREMVAKHGEVLAWLKGEMGLGHGHANAIILYLKDPEDARKKIAADAKHEKTD